MCVRGALRMKYGKCDLVDKGVSGTVHYRYEPAKTP
jgi:hypothetical protein